MDRDKLMARTDLLYRGMQKNITKLYLELVI